MLRSTWVRSVTLTVLLLPLSAASNAAAAGASSAANLFAGADRMPGSPALESLLGFPAGQRPARFAELDRCIAGWTQSERVRVVEHGRTWEGRPLRLVIVSSPANIARLDEIREGWNRVADPRAISQADAENLASNLPAIAWLGMSIHGDEISGVDAGIVLVDHLVHDRGEDVDAMLRELVVVFDVQNPDGRERYLARTAETAGARSSFDSQSVQETGAWPYGRGNHYLFDMNRDWVFATQPETRARIGALSSWRALFFLDAHEMGVDSTYLFYPPRPPFNPYLPAPAKRWWDRFGLDEAAAFDRQGWRYYTGEWADWWFPGYSDTFATFRGAIGILHEQAGVGAGGVRLGNGETLTYRESVAHQTTAAWANLETVAANRATLGRDFAAERRRILAPGGPLADHTLAILPGANRSRSRRFLEDVQRLGAEVDRLTKPFKVKARDPFGVVRETTLPEGSWLIRSRQPEGALLRATLDFDMPLPREVLEKERTALVAGEPTLLYDISGWSLPILYGLDAVEVDDELAGASTTRLESAASADAAGSAPTASAAGDAVAWAFDGADDGSVRAAARLLEAGFRLRLANRPFELDGRAFARGSVLALRDDNRSRIDALAKAIDDTARELDLPGTPIRTGFGDDELPDLGGRYFLGLQRPRVALVGYGSADISTFGALWMALDRGIGTPTSLLRADAIESSDLRRYNVLVLAPGIELGEERTKRLRAWAESGGTLIAVGSAAASLAEEKAGVSGVRKLSDLPDDLPAYREALFTEWREKSTPQRDAAIVAALSGEVEPRPAIKTPGEESGDKEARKQREAYARRFAPQGSLLASRVDTKHWLTSGAGETLPLFVGDDAVLLARSPVEVPIRLGVGIPDSSPASGQEAKGASKRGKAPEASTASGGVPSDTVPAAVGTGGWKTIGWSAIPPNTKLVLRLSGLVWPEAAERLANSAYLTRESVGSGQVILFAGDPVWRGAALGSQRLFANAVVYGPGCGTDEAVIP